MTIELLVFLITPENGTKTHDFRPKVARIFPKSIIQQILQGYEHIYILPPI